MTTRHLMWASLITGLGLLALSVIGLSDPAYYDPQTFLDYAASLLAIVLFLGVAYTLVVWYRATPVRRAVLLLPGAAAGYALWGLGNALEEISRVALGEYVYFFGATLAIFLTALAGAITVTTPTRWRWSGLVLLGVAAPFLVESLHLLAPVPWLVFSLLLWRGAFDEPASPPVSLPN